MKLALIICLSYLFGSIPWALVIGKVFYHKDIRKEGAGILELPMREESWENRLPYPSRFWMD